uniref:Uncharacterized protein n=1 Tax=Rhizophora mucronata TaxID=61149 RepID=A0A2P2K2R1_RHIMU
MISLPSRRCLCIPDRRFAERHRTKVARKRAEKQIMLIVSKAEEAGEVGGRDKVWLLFYGLCLDGAQFTQTLKKLI